MAPTVRSSTRALPLALVALAFLALPVRGQRLRQPADSAAAALPVVLAGVVLAGVVRDTAGRPLSGAEVRTTDRITLSEADGTFLLTGVAGDTVQLLVRRIGYRPAEVLLTVEPHVRRVELAVRLVPAVVELGTITVEGRALSTRLLQAGFYDRQTLGMGTFFDAEYLQHFGGTLGGLLREVPSVQVQYARGTSAVPMGPTGFGGVCPLQVFLDGVLIRFATDVGLDNLLAKEDILAIEVYPRAAQVPSGMRGYGGVESSGGGPSVASRLVRARGGSKGGQPPTAGSEQANGKGPVDCGAIGIWTKPFESPKPAT